MEGLVSNAWLFLFLLVDWIAAAAATPTGPKHLMKYFSKTVATKIFEDSSRTMPPHKDSYQAMLDL